MQNHTLIARFMGPTWSPSGAERWAPCWPHEFCYMGNDGISTKYDCNQMVQAVTFYRYIVRAQYLRESISHDFAFFRRVYLECWSTSIQPTGSFTYQELPGNIIYQVMILSLKFNKVVFYLVKMLYFVSQSWNRMKYFWMKHFKQPSYTVQLMIS